MTEEHRSEQIKATPERVDPRDGEPENVTAEMAERDPNWRTCRLRIPPAQISHLTAVVEAYDNQFILRTEDKEQGVIHLWYARQHQAVLEEILLDLEDQFPVKVLSFTQGMRGLDDIYPEET